ncbi:cyclase family protein, partial [Acinetobacter baumannii]
HFPGFGSEAADYLINQRHVAGLGIDTLSADPGTDDQYATHKIALGKDKYLLENLDNIEALPARGATLITAPLRVENGTGSPARIFAILP